MRRSSTLTALLLILLLFQYRPSSAQLTPTPPNIRYVIGGHAGYVNNIVVSSDGKTFASASNDGTVKIWQMSNGALLHTCAVPGYYAYCVALSPDGTAVAAGDVYGDVTIWKLADDSIIRAFTISTSGGITSLAYSPDGTLLAVSGYIYSSATSSYAYAINLYSTANGTLKTTLTGHTSTITQIAFSPKSSSVLASASLDGTVRIWNTASSTTTQNISAFSYGGPYSVAFSPDGKRVASGGSDNVSGAPTAYAKVWNVANGSQVTAINAYNYYYNYPDYGVSDVVFSPDGTLLATGGIDSPGGYLPKTFNIASGALVTTFAPHSGTIQALAFSNDGSMLISGGTDDVIRQDSVASGAIIDYVTQFYYAVSDVAFPANGAQMAVNASNLTQFYTINTGASIMQGAFSTPFAFSPDGALFAYNGSTILNLANDLVFRSLYSSYPQLIWFSADDQTVYTYGAPTLDAWQLQSGVLLSSTTIGASSSPAPVRSADGTRLAGVSTATGQVSVWKLPSGALIQTFPVTSPSNLAIAADGNFIAFGVNTDAYIYRVSDGSLVLDQPGASGTTVDVVAISPFGDSLAAYRSDPAFPEGGTITVTGVNGQELAYWDDQLGTGIAMMRYTPDGTSILLGRKDATLLVCQNPAMAPALTAITLSQYTAAGGVETPEGTVTISQPAPGGGVTVTLASSNPAAAVPAHVIIPANATSASFPVSTTAVASPTSVTISATDNGLTRSVNLTVNPIIVPRAFSFVPATVEGGADAVGVVTLKSPAFAGGLVVTLSSANPALVSVPTTVTVPSGKNSVRFAVQTGAVAVATTVSVTATASGTPITAKLTVAPATLAALTLVPSTVQGGVENSVGVVTLAAPCDIDVTVTISVTTVATAGYVTYPVSVTIPAGAYNAAFDIGTNTVSSKQIVTFKAQIGATGAAGTTSKTAGLTLMP